MRQHIIEIKAVQVRKQKDMDHPTELKMEKEETLKKTQEDRQLIEPARKVTKNQTLQNRKRSTQPQHPNCSRRRRQVK